MRFGIYGNLSNGDGLCDFYIYDWSKMDFILAKDHICFLIMNEIIHRLLFFNYHANKIDKKIIIQLDEFFRLRLTDAKFRSKLNILNKCGLIEFEKIKGIGGAYHIKLL